ncbi:MAG TPA: EAL domain-containing protein [Paucimonas sp.]|nr:EAL domain-containing protein [Paucimonas sp.]
MIPHRLPAFLSAPALLTLAAGLLVTMLLFSWADRLEHGIAGGNAAWLVLMTGAFISCMAAAWVQMLTMRTKKRLQQLIDAHAADIQQVNERRKEDIAARQHAEAQLAFERHHDGITGLANQELLRDCLRQSIAYADRYRHPLWIVFIDLDRFKFVNDILNRQAGDAALKTVAERLRASVRASDTVARLGGDEFVLLLPERDNESLAEALPQRIMAAVAQPVSLEGREFAFSCSVGIAIYPGDGADPDTLIKHAGIAMYRAQELGQHRFQFYSPAMNQRAQERARIAAGLRRAIEQEEFLLHYQPQVDLHTGRIVGMEALVRWQHPEFGLLGPERFIGMAEEMDLIGPIGEWVLRTACRQNQAWQAAGLGQLRLAVNLSARQFYQRDLAASIAAILGESGLAPHDLELELTESTMMEDVDRAIAILHDLKTIGIHLSIDDFGTGYSSLSYLKRFPIDILKIDQSFVRDITTDPDDAMIVTSIASLARSLRLEVVAEGVETAAQLAFLRKHGCDRMQGFHFSRPLPGDAFAQLVHENRCLPPANENDAPARQTLLIVDDDIHIAASLHRLLHREDYAIVTAQRASEAFEAMALHQAQVILCDQRMPGMSGIEFLDKVKDLYPDTVRIMLTGHADLPSVIEAVNRGRIYRFFTKPWDERVLRDAIRDAFHHYWLQYAAGKIPQPMAEAGADVSAWRAPQRSCREDA